MNDRQLMQQSLDALETLKGWSEAYGEPDTRDITRNAIKCLRARLAQPDPEPVAWMVVDSATGKIEHVSRTRECSESWLQYVATRKLAPLYTAPPQREWQGLTDEEIRNEANHHVFDESFFNGAVWARGKIKEKNNG